MLRKSTGSLRAKWCYSAVARERGDIVSFALVALCYGSATVLALVLLWFFGARGWYWHLLSVSAAVGLGLIPLTGEWNTPERTLMVGWVFFLLTFWGIAGLGMALTTHTAHFRHHTR
jgi:hypothetical protein